MNKKEHSTVYGWEWPKGLPTLLLCVVALNTVLFNYVTFQSIRADKQGDCILQRKEAETEFDSTPHSVGKINPYCFRCEELHG